MTAEEQEPRDDLVHAGQGKSEQQVEDSTWIGGIALAGLVVTLLIALLGRGCA